MHAKREANSSRRVSRALAAAAAAALALGLPAVAGAQQDPGGYLPSEPPAAGGDGGGAGGATGTGGGATFESSATGGGDVSGSGGATDDGATDDGAVTSDGSSSSSGSSGVAGTVTDSSGSLEELPVTGLPAVPLAIAGLLMLVLGALGLRRFSDPPRSAPDPADPSGTRRILGR